MKPPVGDFQPYLREILKKLLYSVHAKVLQRVQYRYSKCSYGRLSYSFASFVPLYYDNLRRDVTDSSASLSLKIPRKVAAQSWQFETESCDCIS